MKSKSVTASEDKNGLLLNSRLKSCPKGLNVAYLSEITARMLTFRDRIADITYCADITLLLYATSDGLSLTAAFFCADFLHFSALNAI